MCSAGVTLAGGPPGILDQWGFMGLGGRMHARPWSAAKARRCGAVGTKSPSSLGATVEMIEATHSSVRRQVWSLVMSLSARLFHNRYFDAMYVLRKLQATSGSPTNEPIFNAFEIPRLPDGLPNMDIPSRWVSLVSSGSSDKNGQLLFPCPTVSGLLFQHRR